MPYFIKSRHQIHLNGFPNIFRHGSYIERRGGQTQPGMATTPSLLTARPHIVATTRNRWREESR
jgi:hypothetical protein